MKIIILGVGKVGYQLAEYLSREGNDIIAVDHDPERIRLINHQLDAKGIVGAATQPQILRDAGMEDADLMVAVTSSDETNMIACQLGYSLFDVNVRIARIRSEVYFDHESDAQLFSTDHIPVTAAISPEREIAYSVLRQLEFPGVKEVTPIQGPDGVETGVTLVGVLCTDECPVIATPLKQLSVVFPDLQLTIVAAIRGDRAFAPHGDDELQAGDIIYFAAAKEHMRRGLTAFGYDTPTATNVTIFGGGRVGENLATLLLDSPQFQRVRLIEKDLGRANQVAERLPKCTVINGSATDMSMLNSLKFARDEVAVTLTNYEEVNVVAAGVLKHMGCRHTMALVTNDGITRYLEKFDVDTVINPRTITISQILRHIRHGRIRRVHTLRDGFAELLEGAVLKASPIAGRSIQDLDLPQGVMVASINRAGKFILPRPGVTINEGDEIAILALTGVIKAAEKILAVRAESF